MHVVVENMFDRDLVLNVCEYTVCLHDICTYMNMCIFVSLVVCAFIDIPICIHVYLCVCKIHVHIH